MIILKAILLGIVQGLTEFIPISSSAHLIIIPWIFQWNDPAIESLTFDIALHLGTLIALIAYFASDWMRLIHAAIASIKEWKIGNNTDRRLAWFLVIGCIPGGITGLMFENKIDRWFHPSNGIISATSMFAMAIIIAIMGGLLFAAERWAQHARHMNQLSLKDSILIGLAQALAIFPGVSRSGSTLTAGLAFGFERETAARFSFLLSAPIIAGAGLHSVLKIYKESTSGMLTSTELMLFPIGFIAAALSGYFCIKFLLRFLQRHPTNIFVYYRWALAVLIISITLIRS